MERERTAVEEREWKRLDEWADAMGIGDLLAILRVNGFLTVSSIIHITMDDLKEMGMEKVGDRKRVLLAAAEGKALHKATQPSLLPTAVLHLPTVLAPSFPKITTIHASPPPSPYEASYSLPATAPPTPPITISEVNLPIAATLAPKWCRKHFHQLYTSIKHSCTEDDRCIGFEFCQHLDLHPEEKKRCAEEKKEKQEQSKKKKKEEDEAHQKEREALLWLAPKPHWDTWYQCKLEKLATSEPDKYSTIWGTRGCSKATQVLAQRFTCSCHIFKQSKAVIAKILAELKLLPHLTHNQQMSYICQRKAQLEGEADHLVEEADQQEAEEQMGKEDEDVPNL